MSDNGDTIYISILGKDYPVHCPTNKKEELLAAASHLDESMRNIQQSGKVIGLDRIAIMAALNITHQLLTDRSQNEQNSTKTSKQLSEIQERIETELGYFDEL